MELEKVDSKLAYLIEAKRALLLRWKAQRFNRRLRKTISELTKANEDHCRTLVHNVGRRKARTSNIMKQIYKDKIKVGFVDAVYRDGKPLPISLMDTLRKVIICASVRTMEPEADHVEVRTKSGSSVRGYRSYAASHRVYTFLGIPYAQPPLHQLRFRLPVMASENRSVVQATLDCPPCPQKDWFSGSNEGWDGAEECLHLNVWTPCAETTAGGGCEKQPVLVFLYAEGFQTGSNQRFDGSLLAAFENLVVVAPNFRLGVLGFFHKDGHEMPGNLALHDQEMVMKWVQEHVELFGGDWNNTVFMGAATGAWSIGAHLVSTNPVWRWRTQRLLLLSESPFRRVYSASPAAFAEAVGCGQNQSSSSCFTELPLQTVLEAGRHFPFGPNYDSRLLPQAPWHMARRFNIIEKQVILGTVYNEGSPLVEILERDGDASDSYMRGAVQELLTSYGVNESGKLVEQYASGTSTAQRGMNLSWAHLLLGDVFFECPLLSFALHLSARGNRVHVYRFDHKVLLLPRSEEIL
ncbi:acetylcholinesterase-like [Dermacentor variabilis]|uniref:acetylcholinesterase-like n=1 Tax=Dermacentor variabilis TaxID=34621 RepID=UPI003F5B2D66